MKCPRCGIALPEGSRFCNSCGVQLVAGQRGQTGQMAQNRQVSSSNQIGQNGQSNQNRQMVQQVQEKKSGGCLGIFWKCVQIIFLVSLFASVCTSISDQMNKGKKKETLKAEEVVKKEAVAEMKQIVMKEEETTKVDIDTEIMYSARNRQNERQEDYIVTVRYQLQERDFGASMVMHIEYSKTTNSAYAMHKFQTNQGSWDYNYDYNSYLEELKALWKIE